MKKVSIITIVFLQALTLPALVLKYQNERIVAKVEKPLPWQVDPGVIGDGRLDSPRKDEIKAGRVPF